MRTGLCALLLVSLVCLTGCGGGSTLPGGAPRAADIGQLGTSRAPTQATPATLSACPRATLFVRMPGEIRGYALAGGADQHPCADIAGPATLLVGNGNGYGAIAVSVHGNVHALAFQSNGPGGLLVFATNANGNAAPLRAVNVDQDHVALAVDSAVNDYVVASENYAGDPCWYVVPLGALLPSASRCDPNLSAIYALAIAPHDELVVLGSDAATSATRIDIFSKPATSAPQLVRTIAGPATGLPAGNAYYSNHTYSLTTDPAGGTTYVLDSGVGGSTAPRISEFDANANGNVAPLRTLSGPHTLLPSYVFALDVMAVDAAANLYVNTTVPGTGEVRISIFTAGASGDAPAARQIEDETLLAPQSGGIAVRT